MDSTDGLTITFAGSGDAFGSGGRFQACVHLAPAGASTGTADRPTTPTGVLLDCGATSLTALKAAGLDPAGVAAVCVTHLHGDHFGGLPFLVLDQQFARRTAPLAVVGPAGTAERLRTAMECLYPRSTTGARSFEVHVVELQPEVPTPVDSPAGLVVTGWEVQHPSGAPPLALRLSLAGRVVAATGDTAWTDALLTASADADLLVAECYYRHKPVPHHLRLTDLEANRSRITARRVVLTHLSRDVLDRLGEVGWPTAHDGMVLRL